MSNPFDEGARATSQASGSFRATPQQPVQATNRFQPLIDSVARAAGISVQKNAQANAELAAQQGQIDIASGEVAIADIQSAEHTTQAYRKGAMIAAEQFETTKALNGFYDVLNTDDGRAMTPQDFDASYKTLMGEVNTGDSSLDNVIRTNLVGNYKEMSEFHAKQHREWAEEDNYAKNTARGTEALKLIDTKLDTGALTPDDYSTMVWSTLQSLDESMPTTDSKRAMFSVLSDEAYKNDNPEQAEVIMDYLSTNEINFTPRQFASNEQARRSYENRANQLSQKQTDLQTGMQKVINGTSASLTTNETAAVVNHQLEQVITDTADKQQRGEQVNLQEELILARADMAREGIYDATYGKQQAANIAPTFYTGSNLTPLEQSSNDRKRLAVDEMTAFAENVQWDTSTLTNMFGDTAVKELIAIDAAKAGNVRDTESVLLMQAKQRDRQTGTQQGGAKRLPVDLTLTQEATASLFESNILQKAFRFLPFGDTAADALNGWERPAGANDQKLAMQYIQDEAVEAQFRNPQLTPEDAAASAAMSVMNNSIMIGENEGMLFARNRNLVKEIGATDAHTASETIVTMAKEQMVDLPDDVAAYYEFSAPRNAIIVELSHPSLNYTQDITIPLTSVKDRVKTDAEAKLESDKFIAPALPEGFDGSAEPKFEGAGLTPTFAGGKTEPTFDSTLKRDEGTKRNFKGEHVSYEDSTGHQTGGRGHKLSDTERKQYPEGTVIPDEVVEQWWKEDTAKATVDMKALVKQHNLEVPTEVEDILHNMVFNLGKTGLSKFEKMFTALKSNDYSTAADEMLDSKWATQVGTRAKRLANRMRNVK